MHAMIATFPEHVVNAITADAAATVAAGEGRYARPGNQRRRATDDIGTVRTMKRQRREELPRSATPETDSDEDTERDDFYEVSERRIEEVIQSDFLSAPTTDTLKERLGLFIDATSNEALRRRTCGSCARDRPEEDLREKDLDEIPNKELLAPTTPHPAHVLMDGMLVHGDSVINDGNTLIICSECYNSLKTEKRPKFSLGNDLWIGDVPKELQDLTLPERMLIAVYFPAAYIVKLFPKQKGAQAWDRAQMHNGLRGNVSTYRLNPNQVTSMLEGGLKTYPRPPKILPATIGVTFVGPKGLPESSMPTMFRVRRRRVRDALRWLKINNTLYADITISEENLTLLPEDGIPEELIMTAKHSADIEAVEREHSGYVPEDAADEETDEVEPMVIPLQSMGVVDIDGGDISSSELLAHALSNSCMEQDIPEDYTIHRGSAFVNEYARVDPKTGLRNDGGPSNPNHLLGCFPTLFPYGMGGIETNRPVYIAYETHVRWTMEYVDRRFRKEIQYPFQVFGVMQKRAVCRSAVLQMKKSTFVRNMNMIANLKPADLLEASKEETRGARFSNPAVRALREELSAVRTKVKGTDESRVSVRSKVWGTNLIFNPPSIWMTINPADSQDPIAQVFAGEEIDMDAFCNTAGPDHITRAMNIAADPYASAQYFHFIVKTVFEELLGIKKHPKGKLEHEYGVLGKVQSYIGTVEAQGRGTLHLHTLIW
ncbi:hypothetical protein CVT25_004618, partial [Psilocybe cyanescens]